MVIRFLLMQYAFLSFIHVYMNWQQFKNCCSLFKVTFFYYVPSKSFYFFLNRIFRTCSRSGASYLSSYLNLQNTQLMVRCPQPKEKGQTIKIWSSHVLMGTPCPLMLQEVSKKINCSDTNLRHCITLFQRHDIGKGDHFYHNSSVR